MAITQISRIQHRRGLRIDLPTALNDAEFGWAEDARELYIGNGPNAPVGGNTQILTELTPASLPIYSYNSNTGATAVTGFERDPLDPFEPNPNYPTLRTYQEKFDDYVSVLDYDAKGDGIADDTAAIRRAMYDIYDEKASPESNLRKYRSLYFPAGTYNITKELHLYPNAVLMGDGPGRTVIRLANGGTLAGNDNCVARTVDSLGQIFSNIGADLGDGVALRLPVNIIVSGITFDSETDHTNSIGQIDIIKIDSAHNVRFDNCDFTSTWGIGTVANSRAISISNPGLLPEPMGDYTFNNCLFANISYGFKPPIDVTNVYVSNSRFDTNFKGVYLDDSITSNLFRVSNSVFENIQNAGFEVQSTGAGNISTYNHYRGLQSPTSYSIAAVVFDVLATNNVSLSDTFDITDVFDCDDKLINTRVRNLSDNNIVMNAQDLFQLPLGFCGNIFLENIYVTGTIASGNIPVTAIDETTVLHTLTYSTPSGAIFVDYAMHIPALLPANHVYRAGTLRIIHDGGSTISYDENYTELNGPPILDIIALEATYGAGSTIEISLINPMLNDDKPTYNFLTRTIDNI